jgi:hypothetical protein
VTVNVTVTNVDEPPVFVTLVSPAVVLVPKASLAGYNVATLTARDPEGTTVRSSVWPRL